jgi:hypothetical protein
MRFQSERDQRLAFSVISQIIALIETLIQRMEPIQSAADSSATDSGRLLLDAVCMQYLALGEGVKQLEKLTGCQSTALYTINLLVTYGNNVVRDKVKFKRR